MKNNLLKAVLTKGPKVIWAYFAWMRKYGKTKNKKYPIEKKYAALHKLAVEINKGLGMELHIVGENNIPNETCCFICNHLNETDPLAIIASLNQPTTFVCKKEVMKMPFVAKCVNSIEGEFIDREDLKESLRTMMKVETDLKEGGKNWLIFPEGTRNKDPRKLLLEFHHGTFRPAYKAQRPIVPVCIYGTQRVLSKKYHFKKYPIYVEFGKPLYYEDYKDLKTNDIASMAQSSIQTMLSYHARKKDRDILIQMLGDKYHDYY